MFRQIEPWPSHMRPLGAIMRDHRRVLMESLGLVTERFWTSILVWLLIGISLCLPAGLYLVQQNLAKVSEGWEGRSGFSVYLVIDAGMEKVDTLVQELDLREGVSTVQIISPEAALNELSEHFQMGRAIEVLGSNPIPFSIRISLRPEVSIESYERIKEWLLSLNVVEEVVIERAWIQRLQSLEIFVERLGYLLMVIFGVGAILVTGVSVRFAMDSRLEEIRVSHVVGGTERFLRRPFYYFGLIYGLGGSIFGQMIIAIVLVILEEPLTKIYASYGHTLVFEGFDIIFMGAMVAFGAGLGVVGANIASRQQIKNLYVQ